MLLGISGYNEGRNETEVLRMFRRKAERRVLELSQKEVYLARRALLSFRNSLLAQGKPTEDIVELLLKIMK